MTDDERVGEHCSQCIPGISLEEPMSAPSVAEPVNEILDSYISIAMERHAAAIHTYTRIHRYLQHKMRSISYIEAFKARLREEDGGKREHSAW